MEFYKVGCEKWHKRQMSFNSQRDGILQDEQDKDVAQIERFNSQRDGILPLDKSMSNPDSAFQFPTGWNSTVWSYLKSLGKLVSIPNGMEFYFKLALERRKFKNVSIPNGMEFYHFVRRNEKRASSVSIPNGMKFY